jgi:hypothetical protein
VYPSVGVVGSKGRVVAVGCDVDTFRSDVTMAFEVADPAKPVLDVEVVLL